MKFSSLTKFFRIFTKIVNFSYCSQSCIICGLLQKDQKVLSEQLSCVLLDHTCLAGMFMKKPSSSSFYHYGIYIIHFLCIFFFLHLDLLKTFNYETLSFSMQDFPSIQFIHDFIIHMYMFVFLVCWCSTKKKMPPFF